MDGFDDYQVRFLDATGAAISQTCIAAESVAVASFRAEEVAAKMHAAGFSLLLLPPKIEG